MKPGKSVDVREEVVEVHSAARSPSPKHKTKSRSRSRSGSRKLSNGHTEPPEVVETPAVEEQTTEKSKRDSWIKSEHESLDIELPIHDQIKQGILGFVEKEIKKSDKNPSFVFYSHDPNGLDEKYMKTLSRPSSGHKEKRSPSYRKKKRHSSKHRDRDLHDFEVPGSSLSALERVDDYLKEYNKDEVVTLSGELEIEANDVENNNGSTKDHHKSRKTRRKVRDERQDSNANGSDVSPKVFKTGSRSKSGAKPARPTDLSAMLQTLESSMTYHDQYIDNPFSSPSPLTSPNDERLNPFGSRRPEKIYLQGGGTFRAVSRDRILESQQSRNEDKYLRLGDLTPLDIALAVQKAWRNCAYACHGVLGGVSLMHLLLISYSDSLDAGHLSFHAVVTMPYVATYYFLCVLCLLSVLDRLDASDLELSRGLQPYFQPVVLVILYCACLLVCCAARTYDELMVYQYAPLVANYTGNMTTSSLDVSDLELSRGLQPYFQPVVLVILYCACLLVCCAARTYDELMVYQYAPLVANYTGNMTTPTIPTFYHTWTHFSIWRAVLSILGLVYFIIANPPDLVLAHISQLLQFKTSLQSIG